MILVVSSPSDAHATVVLRRLADLGAPAELLDLSRFPTETRLALGYGATAGTTARIQLTGNRWIDLADVTAIWWRRPQPLGIDPAIRRSGHRTFAYGESHEALAGLWLSLDTHWVNHPVATETAGRKAYQLQVAEDIGLSIPKTCITNDPEEARAFAAQHPGGVIYKSFSATEQEWRETRMLREREIAGLGNVAYAPVIFQEYIEAVVDLRITVIGDDIFPAAIHSQKSAYPVDFRMDMAQVPIEPATLPAAFKTGLLSLMKRLDIVYGAIDARLTPDGNHVFLEVNPAGQWLFIEQRTRQPITETLARYLASRGQEPAARPYSMTLPDRADPAPQSF
ncbi:MAG: alpha-L-glutamate ligase [Chloroflexota bacterium]|nr:alpha-L-glutamate ligase [Chloroflexota bacterium]